jgi:tricarballylate dehydrogenase
MQGASNETDVVVVGAGNAGLCAALAAAEDGARVVVLEKAAEDEAGGNTYFTAGAFRTAHGGTDDLVPLLHDRVDPERIELAAYSPDDYLEDLQRVTDSRCDAALAEALAADSRDAIGWLAEHGVRWRLMTDRQAYETDERRFRFWGGLALGTVDGGKGLFHDEVVAVRDAGVDLRFSHAVTGLTTDGSGRVNGVVADGPEGPVTFDAGAVILTAGGFQANAALRKQHLGDEWEAAQVRGTPDNTGDLLEPAFAAGADRAGHWSGAHATAWDPTGDSARGDREITNLKTKQSYPVGVVVNRDGRRFLDEGADFRNYTYAKYGAEILRQPGAIAFQLFDADTTPLLRQDEYTSPSIRSATADTLRELANELGIDPDGLEDEIARYNDAVQPGTFDPTVKDGKGTVGLDPDKSNWAQELDAPPFVGFAVTCGITFTFGGLRIDADAQVLDTSGAPVPGLRAAGEIAGGLFFGNYPGGSGLMAGTVFGRRAGRAAAAEVTAARG